jgi:hypothetical protein
MGALPFCCITLADLFLQYSITKAEALTIALTKYSISHKGL